MTNILVIGDAIVDDYIYGDCERISPEAPIPIVIEKSRCTTSGGAGNVVANLLSLGANVVYWHGNKWSYKTRVIVGSHQVCRIDKDDCSPRNISNSDLMNLVRSSDAIVLSDYNKGIIDLDFVWKLDSILSKLGKKIPLFVDPYIGKSKYSYRGHVTLIKPNRKEAESVQILSKKIIDWESLKDAGSYYKDESQAENVVITLGSEGMFLFSNEVIYSTKKVPLNVFDVTGAGDTVIAVLAYLWAEEYKINPNLSKEFKMKSVDFANKAAGIVCQKLGTAIITREELFGN